MSMDSEDGLRDLGISVIGAGIYSVLSERSGLPSVSDVVPLGGHEITSSLSFQMVVLTAIILVGILALRGLLE